MMRLFITILTCSLSLEAYAFSIKYWFENENQRAQRLIAEGQYEAAATQFTRDDWKGVAAYRGQNYQAAAAQFKALNTTDGFYNQGNALAQLGQYQEAIKAYDETLKRDPNHKDAKFNRELLKKIANNQQKEQNQETQSNENQDNQKQEDQKNQDKEEPADKGHQKEQSSENEPKPASGNEEKASENTEPQNPREQGNEQKAAPKPSSSNSAQNDENNRALRLVPDDPGGLLREKFWRDHWRRLQKEQQA